MRVGLDGKTILITGAARGIGAAIAHQAADSGAAGLLLSDRDPIPFDLPCPTAHVIADLSDPTAPERIAREGVERFGQIDGLVNAAGLTTRGSFLDGSAELWDTLFAVNARAAFLLMAQVIAQLLDRKSSGSIVNIQSMNAHCGAPDLAIYAATKGALQTLTKNAANAHLADRIRVNGINLGWVATESERHLHAVTLGKGDAWIDEAAKSKPLGRLVTETEAARTAIYLLSDASAPMTGVSVDLEQAVTGAPC